MATKKPAKLRHSFLYRNSLSLVLPKTQDENAAGLVPEPQRHEHLGAEGAVGLQRRARDVGQPGVGRHLVP